MNDDVIEPESSEISGWVAVRSHYWDEAENLYEERITLWRESSMATALERAEAESKDYAEGLNCEATGDLSAYLQFDEPADGAEIFSLMRDSDLAPSDYLKRFFFTGGERSTDV